MSPTKIAWTDETWSPVSGCSKVSPGCANCYAERLSHRFARTTKPWTPENAAENVVLHPDKLDKPLHWREPRKVFVCPSADLFHELVPDDFILKVFDIIRRCSYDGGSNCGKIVGNGHDGHTFQVLTKRPERMRDLLLRFRLDREGDAGMTLAAEAAVSPWNYPTHMGIPGQAWLGVSIENSRYAGRADILRETPARVRWISAEPLLGPLDPYLDLRDIDWLVIGGESGPNHRPMNIEWLRDLVDYADTMGVKVFVKQDSGLRPGQQGNIPNDLWARKEYPR